MKGFIEVHEFGSGDKCLIGIGNITCVEYDEDTKEKGCRIGCLGISESWTAVRETYEEVKVLITEAQGGVDLKDYVSKYALQEWMQDRRDAYYYNDTFERCKAKVEVLKNLRNFLKREDA